MTNSDEPTFLVTTLRDRTYLEPQFELADLSDDQRELFDGLRETFTSHYTGAMLVPGGFDAAFEEGEELTFDELRKRSMRAAQAFAVQMRETMRAFAPAIEQLAEAIEPLAEIGEVVENSDDE